MEFAIIRFKSQGRRFEIPCLRDQLRAYVEQGRDKAPANPDEISPVGEIYFNFSKGEIVPAEFVARFFHTDVISNVLAHIIQFGEILETEKDRQEVKANARHCAREVVPLVVKMLRNRWTGESPDENEVSDALINIKYQRNIEEHVPLMLQAAFFAGVLCRSSSLKEDVFRVAKRVKVIYPEEEEIAKEWDFLLMANDGLFVCISKKLCDGHFQLDLLADEVFLLAPTSDWIRILPRCLSVESADPSQDETTLFSLYESVTKRSSSRNIDKLKRIEGIENQLSKSAEPIANQPSYDTWPVTELKEECRKRQLATNGKKQDLIDRLETHDTTMKPKRK